MNRSGIVCCVLLCLVFQGCGKRELSPEESFLEQLDGSWKTPCLKSAEEGRYFIRNIAIDRGYKSIRIYTGEYEFSDESCTARISQSDNYYDAEMGDRLVTSGRYRMQNIDLYARDSRSISDVICLCDDGTLYLGKPKDGSPKHSGRPGGIDYDVPYHK